MAGSSRATSSQQRAIADTLGRTQAIAEVQRLTRLRQRPLIALQLLHQRRKTAQQRQPVVAFRQRMQPRLEPLFVLIKLAFFIREQEKKHIAAFDQGKGLPC